MTDLSDQVAKMRRLKASGSDHRMPANDVRDLHRLTFALAPRLADENDRLRSALLAAARDVALAENPALTDDADAAEAEAARRVSAYLAEADAATGA